MPCGVKLRILENLCYRHQCAKVEITFALRTCQNECRVDDVAFTVPPYTEAIAYQHELEGVLLFDDEMGYRVRNRHTGIDKGG